MSKAYLDVETSFQNKLTIVGMYRPDRQAFLQLVGSGISAASILEFLEGSKTISTYNGRRFDLPMIERNLGLNLSREFAIQDLMYDCWRRNLYGGLKAVEELLGIPRTIYGRDDDDPRLLWVRHRKYGDPEALETLLAYNREDVLNLLLVERQLRKRSHLLNVNVPVRHYVCVGVG